MTSLWQIDELFVSHRSVDKGQDREAARALERRQRMVPSVCTVIYPGIAGHPKSAELPEVRHFVRAVWRNEHEITRAIDRNEGLRRMNVPLHLHRRKRERLRLDRHHRKSHPRGSPAVLQLLDELLPSVPRRLGRNKLAERHERRCVDRCNFKTHHEAISQGCSVSQRRAMSSRLQIQTSALPLA